MTKWKPVSLELISGKWLARVERHHRSGWRWSVQELELTKRMFSRHLERAHALGYARSCERAIKLAEGAIKTLDKGGRG